MRKGPPLILKRKQLASPLDQPFQVPTEPNVSTLEQDSAFGQLFFSWSTRLLVFGLSRPQLHEGDLPFLPSNLRASNLFILLKAQPENIALAWRLLRANARPLTMQSILAAVTAALYYGPAFFLNRLIQYLEYDVNDRPPQARAFTYAIGLFACLAADAIIGGQLWLLSSATLASRIRIQLNTLIFEKVLKRKDFTGAAVEDDEEDAVGGGAPADTGAGKLSDLDEGDEDEAFTSKSQCLTVFSVDVDRVAGALFLIYWQSCWSC